MLIYISLSSFGRDLFAMVTNRSQDLRGCYVVEAIERGALAINAKWLWKTQLRYWDAADTCGQFRADDASFCTGRFASWN
jgi:hypothetical protein